MRMSKFSNSAIVVGLYFMLYGAVLTFGINKPGVLFCTIGASVVLGSLYLYSMLKLSQFGWGDDATLELCIGAVLMVILGVGYALVKSFPCGYDANQNPVS